MERRNQVEEGKCALFAERVQGLVHAREEGAYLVENLVVNFDLYVSRLFRDDYCTRELGYGEVECWISPDARDWFRVALTSLAKMQLARWGRALTHARTAFRDRNPKRHQGAGTNVCLGFGKICQEILREHHPVVR